MSNQSEPLSHYYNYNDYTHTGNWHTEEYYNYDDYEWATTTASTTITINDFFFSTTANQRTQYIHVLAVWGIH